MRVTEILIVNGSHGTILKCLEKNGRLRNQRTRGDHTNYNIIKIGQNTEKSP